MSCEQLGSGQEEAVPTTLQPDADGADEYEVPESDIVNSTASVGQEQESDSKRVSFDFLGTASCKKLVPAKSVFRRLKRRSLGSTAYSQQEVGGERLGPLRESSAGLEAVPEEAPVVLSEEVWSSQNGEAADEQVGASVEQERHELRATELEELGAERLVAASQTPRKRFTLPPPSSSRRRSCDGSVFSVCTMSDSEDSMSSAGISESSESCCQMVVPVRRCRSVGSRPHSSTAALDAMFERVKSGAAGSCTASTTAESSRASSPGRPMAGHSRRDAQHWCNTAKPTLTGAARVLSQLYQEEATPALEDRRPELINQVEPRDMFEATERAFPRPKQYYSFCFPAHCCGIPLENALQNKPLVYKNSGARRRRSRRRTAGF